MLTTIVLRPPALVVLVGAAGSGKSTFAARAFPPAEILSSDAFRAIVAGDEADQRATRVAFSIIHREVVSRLAKGRLVVVDATNVERRARLALIARARAAGAPAVAIVFALPDEEVLRRNAARIGRVVDPAVVGRHLELVSGIDVASLIAEGFAAAHVLRSPAEVASIRVEILAAAADVGPGSRPTPPSLR